jgi:hypothetical protein
MTHTGDKPPVIGAELCPHEHCPHPNSCRMLGSCSDQPLLADGLPGGFPSDSDYQAHLNLKRTEAEQRRQEIETHFGNGGSW